MRRAARTRNACAMRSRLCRVSLFPDMFYKKHTNSYTVRLETLKKKTPIQTMRSKGYLVFESLTFILMLRK